MTTSIPIILAVCPLITVLRVFFCYRTYRHKQIIWANLYLKLSIVEWMTSVEVLNEYTL